MIIVIAGGGSGLLEFFTSLFKIVARHDEGKDGADYLLMLLVVFAYFVVRMVLKRILQKKRDNDKGGR